MQKYILIGIPNCGKTTLGQRVAEILQLPFFDTDKIISKRLKLRSPFDMLNSYNSMRFEIEQYNVIEELSNFEGSVIISTGAEDALTPDCARLLKKMGTLIHIERISKTIATTKPNYVLVDENNEIVLNMQEESVKLYAEELPQYVELADYTLENHGTEDEGVEKLVNLIKQI